MSDSTPWRSLPDELCKHIAQHYFQAQHCDVVPLLRLVCRDWKESIDRSVESLYLLGHKSWFLRTQMPHVKEVTVEGCSDANLLENMGQLPGLKRLELQNVRCPDDAFAHLTALGGLQELKLINGDKFPDKKAEHLTALTSLTSCSFHHFSEVDPAAFEALANLPQLRSLTLKGCYDVTDRHLDAFVTGCAPLTQLHLAGWCRVSQEGLQKLSTIPTMKDLQKYRLKPCNI